jgi:probable O-glycosylation ligase (exosortase A-associated)
MRDILVALLVVGAIPFIFSRPWFGVVVYTWLGLMNPHRLTYGFAYTAPFGSVVALVTMVSLLFSSEEKRVPWSGLTVVWMLFVFWINLSTVFAEYPDAAIQEWDRTIKIQLMIFITLLVMHGRFRINAFVWVMVVSLGFYGVKGGVFTVLTGGQYRVMGPWDTFITDNNTLALALIMTLPLIRYLAVTATQKYVRIGLLVAMGFTAMAVISSHSRGAFLAGGTILLFLILKSQRKLQFAMVAAVIVPIMLLSMPDQYFERMETIKEYDQDASAMGRINAWWFAFNYAKDHPLTGGGFGVFSEEMFLAYAPNPLQFHDAHSIYFEVLGEQGFVGLGLFLLLGLLSLRTCTWIIKSVDGRDDLGWARELAAMLQVALIGYATGGAFLGLAYFDYYYDLVATIILLQYHVRQKLTEPIEDSSRPEDQDVSGSLQVSRRLPSALSAAGRRI